MAKQEKTAAELYREERKARIAKAAKKNAKKSHKIVLTKGAKAAIAAVLVVALVAGVGVFAINNSGMLERGKTAFYVGDVEVTAPEYSYYYSSAFQNYFNYSWQYDSYYGAGMGKMYTGYDYSVSPDTQAYNGEIEGIESPMFTDFFEKSAKDSIKYVKASVKYAAENGIELDEADLATVEENIETLKSTAESNNFSVAAYLRKYYSKGMTLDLLRKITEEQTLTSKVQTVKTEEFAAAYSAEEIEKVYNEEINTYGLVSLRLYEIAADTVEVAAESEDEDPTEEVTKETMAAAKAKAESFASKVSSAENFKATAAEFEKLAENEKYEEMKTDDTKTAVADTTYDELSYDVSDEKFLKWAFDEDTKAGETYIVENKDTGYSVYMMEAPVHKAADEYTYDVRHILIKFPEEDSADDADDAEEEKQEVEVELLDTSKYEGVTIDIDVDLEETGDKALYKEAQTILEDYLAGDMTEEAFGELAKKHSADSNAAEGGIYEDVTMGYMLSEFEDWAMEDGRKNGDVGIVETIHGYHIMYFIGTDTTTWADTIRNDKGAEDYNEFADELENGESVAIDGEVEAEISKIEEFVVKLSKELIRAAKQNNSNTAY